PAVDGLDHIGGGEGSPDELGIVEERQVVVFFLSELGDEGRIGRLEALTEFFELSRGDLDVPGSFDGAEPTESRIIQ
ncbi:MAG: hypothetical protein L0312_20385, partial [Acidobacteria bacterium]|nr:hypothetical protein [Acidobacteriota bacterium]